MNPFNRKNQTLMTKMDGLRTCTFSDEMLSEIKQKPVRTFTAKFITEGLCGYKEQNDITLVRECALEKMAETFINRPVIKSPHDLNITRENIMSKASGVVADVFKQKDANDWWVKFNIWDEDLLKSIDRDGFEYVSCAYFITENGGAGRYNGIDYQTEVLDGFYHHLAVTNNPRYNDSDIIRLNEEKSLNSGKFSDIVKFNEDIITNKGENKMFGIKKSPVEVDKDITFKTNCGELTIEEMISKINELDEKTKEIPAESQEEVVEEKPAEEIKEETTEEVKEEVKEEVVESKENEAVEEVKEEETSAQKVDEGQNALTEAEAKTLEVNDACKEAIEKTNEDPSAQSKAFVKVEL